MKSLNCGKDPVFIKGYSERRIVQVELQLRELSTQAASAGTYQEAAAQANQSQQNVLSLLR